MTSWPLNSDRWPSRVIRIFGFVCRLAASAAHRATFTAGYVPRMFNVSFGPGKYALQFVYLDRFRSACPVAKSDPQANSRGGKEQRDRNNAIRMQHWYSNFPGNELIRSNKAPIEFAAPPNSAGTKASARPPGRTTQAPRNEDRV